jgi:hypothetical protein
MALFEHYRNEMSTIDFVLILANRAVFGIFKRSCPVRTEWAFLIHPAVNGITCREPQG